MSRADQYETERDQRVDYTTPKLIGVTEPRFVPWYEVEQSWLLIFEDESFKLKI